MDKSSSKTDSKNSNTPSTVEGTPIEQLSVAAVHQLVDDSAKVVDHLEHLLAGASRLTSDERTHTSGRLRDGEAPIYGDILATVEAHPALFGVGRAIGGVTLDPADLRDQLAKRALLVTLSTRLGEVVTRIDDTVLHLGEIVRRPVMGAYRLARVVAEDDPRVRTHLAPAMDYYARIGRKGQATRLKNSQAKATPDKAVKDVG